MSQAVTVVVVVAVIFHSSTLSGQRHFFRHIIIKNSTNQRSLACIFIFSHYWISFHFLLSTHHTCIVAGVVLVCSLCLLLFTFVLPVRVCVCECCYLLFHFPLFQFFSCFLQWKQRVVFNCCNYVL